MKKTGVLQNKCVLFVCALFCMAALVCGMLFVPTAPIAAKADDAADQQGRVLYYVDCGYLVNSDGTVASRGGAAGLCSTATPYMTAHNLSFGDGAGNGLYNSQTDRNLYYLTPNVDTYDFTQISEDPVTGKYWGTYCEGEGAYGWEWWRRGKTSSTTPGFETARYINENDGDENKAKDPFPLVYKFEVDNTTTPLKITVGTRRVIEGGIGNGGNGEVQVNDLQAIAVEGKDEDKTYVIEEGVYGVNETLESTATEKPYVTVKVGGNGRLTHIAYILIETVPNYETAQTFIKKGETTITAEASAAYPDTSDAVVTLTDAQIAAVNSAEYFSEVQIDTNINGIDRSYNVTVIPEYTEYFVNCGGYAIGDYALADGAYSADTGYGYTTGDKNGTATTGKPQYADYAYYLSCNTETTSLNYRFDLNAGAYGVIVGVTEHWKQWVNGGAGGRAHTVTANGVVSNVTVVNDNDLKTAASYTDVADDGVLTVNIASEQESVITFICVYSANKVSYDLNGGTGEIAGTYFEKGESIALTSTVPAYEDHEFIGWFTAKEGGAQVTGNVTESVTLYAHYAACSYANPVWSWTEDEGYYTAQATLTCQHEGCNHTKTVQAIVTEQVADGVQCGDTADVTFTATVSGEYLADTYTDRKVESGEAVPHDLSLVAAAEASCEQAGHAAYYHCARCGKDFADEHGHNELEEIEDIPALGHDYDYENIAWAWTGNTATASVTCRNDQSHVHSVTATVTSEVTKEATVTEEGVRTYTATVTIDNQTYTDAKTETIPKLTDPSEGDGNTGDDNNGTTAEENGKKSGCGSAMNASTLALGMAALGAATVALVVRKKKAESK